VRTSAFRLSTALAALLLLLAACGPSGNPSVAASVNGEEIPVAEVEERYEAIAANPQFQQQLEAGGGDDFIEQVQARLLSDLIEAELVAQGAADLGVEISEADVEERRESLIEEVGGQETFEQLVEESGLTEEQIDEQVRDITLREEIQEELSADIDVTDEEVEAFFEENREERFDVAEARHILVESEDEADDVIERLEDGESFADIAQEESIDTGSGEQGGDLGQFGRGQMVPEFEEAVFSAPLGEVVGPVETQFGFHVIEVIERAEPDLEEVEEEIRVELAQARQGEVVQEWLTERRQEADIEVNPRFGEWDATTGQVISSAGPLEGPPGAPQGDPQQAPDAEQPQELPEGQEGGEGGEDVEDVELEPVEE
jgi:peptidyl-prolyl cis-trans isomerase C